MLDQHWNGSLLDSLATVLALARTMTYKQGAPIVQRIRPIYANGVKLTAKAMDTLEARFERDPDLGKYFVHIAPWAA